MSDWAQLEQDLLPLDLAALLDKVNGFVHRYVVVGTAEGIAITLWVAHCWVLNAFDATGYLEVRSPVRRCGKTTLLDVLDLLTPRSRKAIEPSEAVLFRRISGENGPPTLLLDETDAIFNRKSESTEGLRACLNAGNRRGTKVPRCVPPRMDVAEFEVFCAKALAGIGGLPATITDRSIPVEMRRKQPGDRVERFRTRKAREQAAPIAAALERWGAGSIAELEVELIKVEGLADDGQPLATLDDRAWENAWEPLLAVASLAGDEWRAHAIAAAVELSGSRDDQLDEGINLLADIRRVFDVHLDRVSLSTQELLDELLTLEESPWRDAWSDPRSDDIKPSRAAPRKLAQTLRPFGIHPADVWMPSGVSRKGYRLDDFRDGWDRYLAEHEPSTDARDGLGARDPGAHADSHLADEERESARPADEPRDARGESAISSRSHAPRAHRPTGEGEWLARDGVWHSIPDEPPAFPGEVLEVRQHGHDQDRQS